jgi:hypothetical protein
LMMTYVKMPRAFLVPALTILIVLTTSTGDFVP